MRIIIVAAVITWFIPGGHCVKKEVIENGKRKEVVVYEEVEENGHKVLRPKFEFTKNKPQTWQVFAAPFKGFVRQAGIIVFIFMVGGAFWIVNSTRAFDVVIGYR